MISSVITMTLDANYLGFISGERSNNTMKSFRVRVRTAALELKNSGNRKAHRRSLPLRCAPRSS